MLQIKFHVVCFDKMAKQTPFYKYDMYYKIEFNSLVRGHHVYKRCWTPSMGEIVLARKDPREEVLEYDKYAIGIFKEQEEELVGHIPIELSQLIYHFLNESNENFAEASVIRKRMREIGLVVPAKYGAFTKTQRTTNILHSELKNKKAKYDLLNLEIITECVCKFPYYKKKQRISD